jgi:hypothetical protein
MKITRQHSDAYKLREEGTEFTARKSRKQTKCPRVDDWATGRRPNPSKAIFAHKGERNYKTLMRKIEVRRVNARLPKQATTA